MSRSSLYAMVYVFGLAAFMGSASLSAQSTGFKVATTTTATTATTGTTGTTGTTATTGTGHTGGGNPGGGVSIVVASLSVTTGSMSGGYDLTVNGSGFGTSVSAVRVFFGLEEGTVLSAASTQLVVTVPAAQQPGMVSVQVNINPYYGVLANAFDYEADAPSISGLTPGNGALVGGNTVVISGSDFFGVTSVKFGGVSAAHNDSMTAITATVPAAAAPGTVTVEVECAGGTATADYTYDVPAPVLATANPATGPVAGGTDVTIGGQYLTGAMSVYFGNTASSYVYVVSDNELVARSPAATAVGAVDIRVETGRGPGTLVAGFTYAAPMLAITFVTTELEIAQVGMQYSSGISVTGGMLSYVFEIDAATPLPSGLLFHTGTGALIGTPAEGTEGSYNITFHVMDAPATGGTGSATETFELQVLPAAAPVVPPLQAASELAASACSMSTSSTAWWMGLVLAGVAGMGLAARRRRIEA